MDGRIAPTDLLRLMVTGVELKPVEIGIFAPDLRPAQALSAGEVGYVATGLKTVRECRGRHLHPGRPPGSRIPSRLPQSQANGIRRYLPVDGEDYAI